MDNKEISTYLNSYTHQQLFLFQLISLEYSRGYGYRKIAKKLKKWSAKTPRGNTCYNTSVSSILKCKRDARIDDVRNKECKVKIGKPLIHYEEC